MAVNDKSAQSDFLNTVAGIDGLWATLSGGVPSVQQTESYDGGSVEPDLEMGNKTYSDVTVTRPFKAMRDAPLAARLRPLIGSFVTTAAKQPTDRLKSKVNVKPTTYSVVLKSVADPDTDAAASATGMLSLTFGCFGVK